VAALGDGRGVFVATDPEHGLELWVTDGTSAGTRRVMDIWPGQVSGSPEWLTPLGDGRVLFAASAPGTGRELWTTDGTEAGTRMVANLAADTPGQGIGPLTGIGGGRAVFSARDGSGTSLYITDGTAAGTVVVPAARGQVSQVLGNAAPLGDTRTVFCVWDNVTGSEPWVTDGTPEGTHLLKDIQPGRSYFDAEGSWPGEFTALGAGKVAFRTRDARNGHEVWLTDGTLEGTVRVTGPEHGLSDWALNEIAGPWGF
jgi:ELWxxDGT repeat protein